MSLRLVIVIALLVLVGSSSVSAAPPTEPLAPAAVGTAFTYQGRLLDNGTPATGPYDFQFKLYDALSGGAQIGGIISHNDITVANGLFTVALDFGANAFNGNPRYLQVEVRPGASTGSYTSLTPRQLLTPAPYAMYTTNADQLDGLHASSFLATSGGTVNGTLDVNGVLLGYYGGGVAHGGDPVTDRFLVGSLPPNNSNNAEKLFVTVWGGGWYNTTLGQSFFSVSSRGGLKVTRTQLFGSTGMYALKVYSTTVGYDVVIEVINQSYPDIALRSFKMGGNADGFIEQSVTGGYSITGKPDVTPVIENHIIVDDTGNVGIGTDTPGAKLDVAGGSVLLDANASLFGNATSGNRGFIQLYNGSTGDLSLGTTFGTGDVSITAGNAEKVRIQADNFIQVPYGFALAQSSGKNILEDRSNYGDSLRVAYNAGAAQFTAGVMIYGGGDNLGVAVRNNGRVGIGTSNPQQTLDISGTTRTKVVQITGGADLAEPFDVSGDRIEVGYVVSIDPDQPGELRVSDRAYDTTVAGCLSGANGVNPGLIMQHEGTSATGQYPVALSGRVYCYADATFGAIAPGDLLTTSDTPGHLQIVADYDRARGAIVGKAMSALKDGRGLILVLVTLQ